MADSVQSLIDELHAEADRERQEPEQEVGDERAPLLGVHRLALGARGVLVERASPAVEGHDLVAFESGEESLSAAGRHSRFLGRCSTTFVVLVLIAAILIYSFTPLDLPFWQLVAVRVAFLLPIAGLSYELIRFASMREQNWFLRALLAPGVWFQRLTVREPDQQQLRVALEALRAARRAAA